MKLTYIVSGISRSVFFEITAVELKKKGYDIDFILIGNHSNDFELFLQDNHFKFTRVLLKGWLSYPACIKHIYKILKTNRPDIVHTHLTTANILGLTAAAMAGIKLRVFTKHSGQIPGLDLKLKLYDYITLTFSVYAVAITAGIKKALVKQKYKEDNIQVIHHGFNIDRFGDHDAKKVLLLKKKYNPDDKYPVIGLISRCVEWKGIQYAIPAFKKLLSDYPNALLCLFNFSENGEFSKQLNDQLNDIPRNSYIKIEFENSVYDMYQVFDIFVHIPVNPFSEAFGQVYIESLAAGIPSVFTLSGIANDFVIHNENALVVDYKNSEEVYQAIRKLLDDKSMSERLVYNGKEAVREAFSIGMYITQLDNFYKCIYNLNTSEKNNIP